MSRLLNLVLNENMKIMHRSRFWLMIVISIISVFCLALFMNNGNQDTEKVTDIWGFITTSTELLFLAQFFAVIIAGDIVASEFSWGTIKLLLIRPANRTKILLAKYLTVVLFSIFFMSIILLSSLLFGILLFHNQLSVHQDLFTPSKIFSIYFLQFVRIIMDVTFAFTLSTLFRSSSLAIGLSIFLMFTGNAVVQLLHHFDVQWGKYFLYANTDLTQYMYGNQVLFKGMTISFSIIILCTYFALFQFLSWFSFIKRDIDV
jgi:ABC-2 type transport system permease protein